MGDAIFNESDENIDNIDDHLLMFRYKTKWCPFNYQHNWTYCVYAHNYQDYRRDSVIGYGPVPCPDWDPRDTTAQYSRRCKRGVQCPFSHGAKERAYHPLNFKVDQCSFLSLHRAVVLGGIDVVVDRGGGTRQSGPHTVITDA